MGKHKFQSIEHEECGGDAVFFTGESRPPKIIDGGTEVECEDCGAFGEVFIDDEGVCVIWDKAPELLPGTMDQLDNLSLKRGE